MYSRLVVDIRYDMYRPIRSNISSPIHDPSTRTRTHEVVADVFIMNTGRFPEHHTIPIQTNTTDRKHPDVHHTHHLIMVQYFQRRTPIPSQHRPITEHNTTQHLPSFERPPLPAEARQARPPSSADALAPGPPAAPTRRSIWPSRPRPSPAQPTRRRQRRQRLVGPSDAELPAALPPPAWVYL